MSIVPSKATVPAYPCVHAITPARQAYVNLYHENIRNGFRFLGYGLQKEDETYGPGGRANLNGGRKGGMVDIHV